jgi:hypothetical protein
MVDNIQVPVQVQNLINQLNDPNEKLHIRDNYRQRLSFISDAINEAIEVFVRDSNFQNTKGIKDHMK